MIKDEQKCAVEGCHNLACWEGWALCEEVLQDGKSPEKRIYVEGNDSLDLTPSIEKVIVCFGHTRYLIDEEQNVIGFVNGTCYHYRKARKCDTILSSDSKKYRWFLWEMSGKSLGCWRSRKAMLKAVKQY